MARPKVTDPVVLEARREYARQCARAYYQANKDKIKANYRANPKVYIDRSLAWAKANPDKAKASKVKYRDTHRAKINEARRAHHKAHPEQRKAQAAKRWEALGEGKTLPTMVYVRVAMRCNGRCGICGEVVPLHDITFDHIKPLSRGGLHEEANLQLAHGLCNRVKWNTVEEAP